MAKTTKSDVIIPDLFDAAVQAGFRNKNAFMGSEIAQMGAVVINGSMPEGKKGVGNQIKVPYFTNIGAFEDISSDGNPATPAKITQTSETATVAHSALAFEATRWAQEGAVGDLYSELARQVMVAAERKMDSAIVTAACASGGLAKDYFSASSPRNIDWDMMMDARILFGDEQSDIVGLIVHSRTLGDLFKLKDAAGNPLLQEPAAGGLPTIRGVKVTCSDSLPLDSSTMSSVTSSGTSPPVITLTGTPNRYIDLRVECTTLGALATWKMRYSIDGGQNWTTDVTSAATVLLGDASDNGASTGVTLNIAAGSAAVDNVWTAKSVLKHTSLLVKRNALAFWYNRDALKLQTDRDILVDSDIGAVHLYAAAHRYSKLNGLSRGGVVKIRHNGS